MTFNNAVRYQLVTDPTEIDQAIAVLPSLVTDGLTEELSAGNEAHRYHLDSKRAYYFQRDGDNLHIWIWNEVDSYEEAASLLTLIVNLSCQLTEERAHEIYVCATSRSVGGGSDP